MSRFNERVITAITQEWGGTTNLEESFGLEELEHDWIVWQIKDGGMAGGMQLIVPKQGAGWFCIPSNYAADDISGVSWEYEVSIISCPQPNQDLAKVLSLHLKSSRIDAFKALKSAPVNMGVYFLEQPLELARTLVRHGVVFNLERKLDRGGYSSTNVTYS